MFPNQHARVSGVPGVQFHCIPGNIRRCLLQRLMPERAARIPVMRIGGRNFAAAVHGLPWMGKAKAGMETEFLETRQGRRIAFHRTPGRSPGVVFLGGFSSDMEGTKALFLEDWARTAGQSFLRFDYSGHGQSSGEFVDGCIGDWADDAIEVIQSITEGPQIMVGSSMGGWIALLVALALPKRVAGIVGIAAAPDFTEDLTWAELSPSERETLRTEGHIELPSDYSDEPYVFTWKLIEDGREHLVLRDPLVLDMPVRLLHGTADQDVRMSVPLALLDHARSPDMRLTLVKDSDHRFSAPENLALIQSTVESVIAVLKSER